MNATALDQIEYPVPAASVGEPAWPVALLFPSQGEWTEEDYLALDTKRLIELSNGCLEVLPMPTPFHQLVAQFLFKLLDAFVILHKLGLAFMAPFCVRLRPKKIRQPDVVFLRPGRLTSRTRPSAGADLAMEVVSEGAKARERDLVTKRTEYARARIPEYWIIDLVGKRIILLTLHGKKYRLRGEYVPGEKVASIELPGFEVEVAAVFGMEDMLPPELRGPAPQGRVKRKRKPSG
jgi:Uma2 family endonuclease